MLRMKVVTTGSMVVDCKSERVGFVVKWPRDLTGVQATNHRDPPIRLRFSLRSDPCKL